MKSTKHFQQRMSQRGVNRAMVDVVLAFGAVDQDKHVLGKRQARELIESRQQELRALKKIADKGGVTVVADGDSLITTYNVVEEQ